MNRHRVLMVVVAVSVAFFGFMGPAHAFWVCGDNECNTTGPHPETCQSCPEDCCPGRAIATAASPDLPSKEAFLAQLAQAPSAPEAR